MEGQQIKDEADSVRTGPEIIYINILVRGQLLFAVTAP